MSGNRNRGSRDLSNYDSMTTQELEQILRLDAAAPEGEGSDTEELLSVMEVLANRRRNTNHTGKTAQEAWESFQQNYLSGEDFPEHTPEMKKPVKTFGPGLRRLAAAAAAVILVVSIPMTAKAFGWGDLWSIVADWAKETFSFSSGEQTKDNIPDPEDFDEYTMLRQLLLEHNRDASLIPTWIPEGFREEKIEADVNPVQEIYIAYYTDGDKELTIRIQTYISSDAYNVEIEEDAVEIYEVSGVEYYIFSNVDQNQAIWIKDSYECNLSGDLSVEEIKLMIDSIGKG